MRLLVLLQNVLKEGTHCRQDHLVSVYLMAIFTGQSNISKVNIVSKTYKIRIFDVFEVVPLDWNFYVPLRSAAELVGLSMWRVIINFRDRNVVIATKMMFLMFMNKCY